MCANFFQVNVYHFQARPSSQKVAHSNLQFSGTLLNFNLHQMISAFKRILIIFLIFILVLVGLLIAVIQRASQYGSLPETLRMVNFADLLIGLLAASILILISIVLTFWLAHAWSIEQPSLGKQIVRLATVVSILLILVFGGMGSLRK